MFISVNDTKIKYPYSVDQLRKDNPNTSFPSGISIDLLSDWNVYPVKRTTVPIHDSLTESVFEVVPILIDGFWTQVWEVKSASEQEISDRKQEIKNRITEQVQERLDTFAQTRGYDNIVSACSYATSTHPRYGPEGRYCVQVREATWDKLFQIEAQVLAGTRPMPRTYAEIEPELPVLAWPA